MDAAYEASLKDGINFSKPEYPPFVENVSGISMPESWGRWSDGKEVVFIFNKPLHGKFKLVLKATVLPANADKPILLKVGGWNGSLKMTADPFEKAKDYSIQVNNSHKSNEIRITIPNPAPPGNGDPRHLGIAFFLLNILAVK